MSRAELVGLVRFVRIDATGAVTGRCAVLNAASARRALPCGPGETVTSAASHAIGMPRGLARDACRSCGNHPRLEKCDRCAVCQAAHKAASAMAFKVRSGITKGWGGAREGAGVPKTRSQSRHRPGYWRDYYADPVKRETRNAAKRLARGA